MRHTAQPLTAGDRHGFPVLVECALQRKAWCMASFEEEGSVVAVIGDLCGYLAAPHHGIRDDGLVGVHCDVLHGDLLLAIAPMAVERLGKPRERSRGLVGECQVPGTDLEALFRDPGALRLLFGRARSTGALEPGNAASICRRTYILAAGSLENAVPRLPMCFPMSTSRPTTSECARQLTVRPAVPLSEGAQLRLKGDRPPGGTHHRSEPIGAWLGRRALIEWNSIPRFGPADKLRRLRCEHGAA